GSYHQDAEPKTSPPRQGPPRVKIGRTGTPREQKQTHRPLLLADAQWLEDHDHARGVLPPVYRDPGRHLQGRPVQAAVLGDLAQQPHAGHRRSRRSRRQADLDLRVRRDPAISRPQDRKILSAGRTRPRRGRAVAVLANGQPRPQGRGGEPLPTLCAREAAIRHRALQQRDEPNLRRHEHAAKGPRISRRQLFDRRYRLRRLGEPGRAPRPRPERLSKRQALAPNLAGASGGQTRSVREGGSGLSRRHERSERARGSVQSESALKSPEGRSPARPLRSLTVLGMADTEVALPETWPSG